MKDKTLGTTSGLAGHNIALLDKRAGSFGIAAEAASLMGTGVRKLKNTCMDNEKDTLSCLLILEILCDRYSMHLDF